MAFMMYSADEAIDSKFIITKSISNQAKPGTLIHIMDSSQTSDGISVDYRVTGTNQDYTVKFDNLKQFCKWMQPDSFIARHYECLTSKDILYYLKVNGRSFATFWLPLILIVWVAIWVLSLLILPTNISFIIAAVLSLGALVGVFFVDKKQKANAKMRIWSKVADSKWNMKI